MTLLNRELASREKLCLVSVFPDLVKDCPKIRNLPKIFLRSFENMAPSLLFSMDRVNHRPISWDVWHLLCSVQEITSDSSVF